MSFGSEECSHGGPSKSCLQQLSHLPHFFQYGGVQISVYPLCIHHQICIDGTSIQLLTCSCNHSHKQLAVSGRSEPEICLQKFNVHPLLRKPLHRHPLNRQNAWTSINWSHQLNFDLRKSALRNPWHVCQFVHSDISIHCWIRHSQFGKKINAPNTVLHGLKVLEIASYNPQTWHCLLFAASTHHSTRVEEKTSHKTTVKGHDESGWSVELEYIEVSHPNSPVNQDAMKDDKFHFVCWVALVTSLQQVDLCTPLMPTDQQTKRQLIGRKRIKGKNKSLVPATTCDISHFAAQSSPGCGRNKGGFI